MAEPRATSTDADELAATLSAMKSRLNELESSSGSGLPPVGTILDFLGEVAPSGWTLLDGSTIVNGALLYPALWVVLPNIYKSGNNIVLPDTRGKVLVHRGAAGVLNVNVGSTGGAETVTLNSTQMPVHNHSINHNHTETGNEGAHTHPISTRPDDGTSTGGWYPTAEQTTQAVQVSNTNNGTNHKHPIANFSGTSGDAGGTGGSTQAHENMPPYMIVTKIMRLV